MHKAAGTENKKGFTLIELLIVLTILSILVGGVILSIGGAIVIARKTAYTSVKQQVQLSVEAYQVKSVGNYPLTGNTILIDGKTLGIIDVCSLLITHDPYGLFKKMPDGFISIEGDDNCDSQEHACPCDVQAHYIWATDVNGIVYSSCIDTQLNGGGCGNTGQDGFQGVWP